MTLELLKVSEVSNLQREPVDVPSIELGCTRCGEWVVVMGALSTIREPFVCVFCLDPRHRDAR